MGAFFPELKKLGPVSEAEGETLRSLNRACTDLRGEWEPARALAFGLMAKIELLKDCTALDHQIAVHEAYHAACAYERQISASTWRYASVAAVLGVMVTDRLAAGRPPLSSEAVRAVAGEEPTLAAAAPGRRRPARPAADRGRQLPRRRAAPDPGPGRRRRVRVCRGRAEHGGAPDRGGGCRLTEVSPEGTEPFWIDVLEPVLALAEWLQTEITRWVRHRGRTQPS
ncbi:hypothetical protein ACIBCO_40930 [Streptomyces violascens]|uniref:hypothetical protein n=1 Tax=Streptomyces violascens TaxID=67381 RepID=UPI0037B222A3